MDPQAHPWFRKDWPLLDLEQVNAVRAVAARGKPGYLSGFLGLGFPMLRICRCWVSNRANGVRAVVARSTPATCSVWLAALWPPSAPRGHLVLLCSVLATQEELVDAMLALHHRCRCCELENVRYVGKPCVKALVGNVLLMPSPASSPHQAFHKLSTSPIQGVTWKPSALSADPGWRCRHTWRAGAPCLPRSRSCSTASGAHPCAAPTTTTSSGRW